jgi:hypothetical protein
MEPAVTSVTETAIHKAMAHRVLRDALWLRQGCSTHLHAAAAMRREMPTAVTVSRIDGSPRHPTRRKTKTGQCHR